jgi:hypothetical protein
MVVVIHSTAAHSRQTTVPILSLANNLKFHVLLSAELVHLSAKTRAMTIRMQINSARLMEPVTTSRIVTLHASWRQQASSQSCLPTNGSRATSFAMECGTATRASRSSETLIIAHSSTSKHNVQVLATVTSPAVALKALPPPPAPLSRLLGQPKLQLLSPQQQPSLQRPPKQLLLTASVNQTHQFVPSRSPWKNATEKTQSLPKASVKDAQFFAVLAQKLATVSLNHTNASCTPKISAPTLSLRSLRSNARCFATLAT